MKGFLKEFKEFIDRGNVVDLAVAVAVGAAFTAIVNSLVSDLVMPLVSALMGGLDLSDLRWDIPLGAGQAAITYGHFINTVIQFLIIAFVIFLLVKGLNKMRNITGLNEPVEVKKEARCVYCKELVIAGATRCPHCTAELPEPAKEVEVAG